MNPNNSGGGTLNMTLAFRGLGPGIVGFGRSKVAFFTVKTVLFAKLSAKLIVNHCILTTLLKN